MPSFESVLTNAMGRGATALVKILYMSLMQIYEL